MLLALEE